MDAMFKCIMPNCSYEEPITSDATRCGKCEGLLDVVYNFREPQHFKATFKSRKSNPGSIYDDSGVWRFRELLPFAVEDFRDREELARKLVSLDGLEGGSRILQSTRAANYVGLSTDRLYFDYEGFNPSGSFKDNGMATAFTHARMLGRKRVVCSSTGNTSTSMAAFAANELEDMQAYVFIGEGRPSQAKIAHTQALGAKVLQLQGSDFDDAMRRVEESAKKAGLYIVNSINPLRAEGQKTMMYRILERFDWEVPDWIVVPGGNLGNTSAFGKAFSELYDLNLIDRIPRIAVITATGANTFYRMVNEFNASWNSGNLTQDRIDACYRRIQEEGWKPSTLASAIEIGAPVNLPKALRTLELMSGVVEQVSDSEIMEAKAVIDRNGFGCEPASAATLAGIKKLRARKIIKSNHLVVGVLTGHILKDPKNTAHYHEGNHLYSNPIISVPNDLDLILSAMK